MLAEGLHIYFMVVRVFHSGRGRKLYYIFIGWGKKKSFASIARKCLSLRCLFQVSFQEMLLSANVRCIVSAVMVKYNNNQRGMMIVVIYVLRHLTTFYF